MNPPMEVEVRHGVMRPGWYWWIAMLASTLIVGVGAVMIALHVNSESDRKWCSVVTTMDGSYREQPPVTATGKKLAEDMARLRRELRCPTP